MAFIKDLNAWKRKTEDARRKMKTKASVYVTKKVLEVYKAALTVSPQWSGNYAYNWVISYTNQETNGRWDPRFKKDDWREVSPVLQAGSPVSINAALRFAESQLEATPLRWNSTIRLVNNAPVAKLIESGEVKLRPENLIPGNQGVIAYLHQKFPYLGK